MVLACSFIILSNLSIAPTFCLLYLLIKEHQNDGLLIKPLQGDMMFYSDGRVILGDSEGQCTLALFPFVEWFLLLRIDKGWCLLWRDSVDTSTYRQLVIQIKRDH